MLHLAAVAFGIVASPVTAVYAHRMLAEMSIETFSMWTYIIVAIVWRPRL